MRIVLDTNVLVSALLSARGAPYELLQRWEREEFTVVTSLEQRDELLRVLDYPKLRLRIDADQGSRLTSNLEYAAEVAINLPAVAASPDDSDNVILASAIAGQASHVVTGDKSDLLRLTEVEGVLIVTPRRMIEIFDGPR